MKAQDLGRIVARLDGTPITLDAAIITPPKGVPGTGGFYAWWVKKGALADVPNHPHPLDPALSLLYVGISPARASSGQTLRGRVIGNHINGNTGSSTFRFVLASFLLTKLGLHPRKQGAKVELTGSDNERLRKWQHENLRLTWSERERPWEIEHSVIAEMKPPLNAAGNSSHPFYSTVKAKRASFRAAAS